MPLKLMYITNDLQVALIAEKYGVDRIWIDLETIGKEERQYGKDTVISHHTVEDIARIKPHLSKSEMLVRINPWYDGSRKEIDDVIHAGAEIVMLSYWKTPEEIKKFLAAVNGRARTMLLLETKEADECLDQVLRLPGIDEIHIGLNDLHLSYGLDFMFELLTNGTVERLCRKIAAKGIPYGFGGIARIGHGTIPAEKIILEHYRLGSTRAILSRSFCDTTKITDLKEIDQVFKVNMKELRDYEQYALRAPVEFLLKNQSELSIGVDSVVKFISARKRGEEDPWKKH